MIGTGLAIGLALAGMGASTAKDIYGTHSANKTNKTALDYQHEADATAAANAKTADDAARAEKKREYDVTQSQNSQRWQDYLRVNEPYWQAGSGVLKSLYGLAGMRGNAPSFSMPDPGTVPPTSMGGAPMAADVPPGPTGASGARPPRFTPMPVPQTRGIDLASLMALANGGGFGSTPVAGGT